MKGTMKIKIIHCYSPSNGNSHNSNGNITIIVNNNNSNIIFSSQKADLQLYQPMKKQSNK